MAFEGFLSDSRGRPRAAAVFGYVASMAAHGPPLAVFVSTWLTHAFVIGSSGSLPDHMRAEPAYHIPLSLVAAARGDIGGTGEGVVVGGDETRIPSGIVARPGRGTRRGLVAPREIQRLPDVNDPLQAYLAGFPDAPEDVVNSGTGLGRGVGGRPGLGAAAGGPGLGKGGDGSGSTTIGAGLRIAAVAPPAPKQPPAARAPGDGHAQGQADDGDGDPLAAMSPEELVPPTPGKIVKPVYISSNLAAYFRTVEHFPSLPESYWRGGQSEYPMMVEICVSTEGTVARINVQQNKDNNADIDELVVSAIRNWRYRPRMIAGYARPFCHPIRIEYSRRARTFGFR
jgi:TonB family protein